MKKKLILVHGALASANQFSSFSQGLAEHFECAMPNLSGHGGLSIPAAGYSFDLFADDLLRFLNEHQIEKASFFGYSMGGYAAMVLALKHPERVDRIVTLGTKFDWNPISASKETQLLNVDLMEQKIPAFTVYLAKVHDPVSWKNVVRETALFMQRLGESPDLNASNMKGIRQKCLLLVGDKDATAGVDATRKAAMCLENAAFQVLSDTPHVWDKVNTAALTEIIVPFLR